jgi:hypothetical protein
MVTVLLPGGELVEQRTNQADLAASSSWSLCAGWKPGGTSVFWPGSLGFHARGIYQWRERYRLGGRNVLRSTRGRLTKAATLKQLQPKGILVGFYSSCRKLSSALNTVPGTLTRSSK